MVGCLLWCSHVLERMIIRCLFSLGLGVMFFGFAATVTIMEAVLGCGSVCMDRAGVQSVRRVIAILWWCAWADREWCSFCCRCAESVLKLWCSTRSGMTHVAYV